MRQKTTVYRGWLFPLNYLKYNNVPTLWKNNSISEISVSFICRSLLIALFHNDNIFLEIIFCSFSFSKICSNIAHIGRMDSGSGTRQAMHFFISPKSSNSDPGFGKPMVKQRSEWRCLRRSREEQAAKNSWKNSLTL